MMRLRNLLLLTVGLLLLASPAFALFTNGGFEDGTTSGWTLEGGHTTLGGVGGLDEVLWTSYDDPIVSVVNTTHNDALSTIDSPFYDNYMVKINDSGGSYDATRISQSGVVAASDISSDGLYHLYFSWGAVLNEPTNIHPTVDQPFFDITVNVNGATIYNDYLSADQGASAGWSSDVYSWWYNMATIDIDSIDLGDTVDVLLTAVDCGWGGHGGYAFLDGFGSTYIPPVGGGDPVPEPGTILLLGAGLIGLAIGRKKFMK